MLDSAFNNLSLSGWYKDEGNRPPALSTSSLSSIGEDLNHRIEGYKGYNGNPQTSSPKSPGSTNVAYYTSNSPNGRSHASSVDTTRSFGSKLSGVEQLGSSAYSNKSLSSLNHSAVFDRFSEESNQSEYKESRLFNRLEHRSLLSSDYDRNSQNNFAHSETPFGLSAFGNWNSLQKLPSSMGSLYENEEFLGNKTRSISSGSSLGFVQNQDANSNRIMTTSYTSSVPSTPDRSSLYQRQRVQSADAVHNNSLRNQVRHFETGSPMHYPGQMNRNRSFSTGYKNANVQADHHHQVINPAQTDYLYADHESNMCRNFERNSSYGNHLDSTIPYPVSYRDQDSVIRLSSLNAHRNTEPQQYYTHNPPSTHIPFHKRTVYTVKFKRSQKNFFLSERINSEIKIGTYVRVEADRGEDLGIVLSRIPIEKFNPGARLSSMNMGLPDLQLKHITRLASEDDIAQYALKEEEEAELLKICRSKTLQRRLPMNVIDAEYQFDRHKLTFFFEASGRVDFRELVRDLFSIYKTRIWMQQVDKVSESPSPEPINLYGSDW